MAQTKSTEGDKTSLESRHRWLLWLVAEATSEVVRADDETMLLRRICAMLVQNGFRFAWAGLLEPNGRRIAVTSVAARDSQGLALLEAPQADEAAHRFLIERLRQATPWVTEVSPPAPGATASAWVDLALGLQASRVGFFPLGSGGIVHGILVLGTDDRTGFDPASMALLGRLAGDCGVKLDRLGRAQTGAPTDVALRDALGRFHLLYDDAPDAILLVWPDRLEHNDTLKVMFGIRAPGKLGRSQISGLFDPDVLAELQSMHQRRRAGRPAPERYESVGKKANGQRFRLLVRVRPIELAGEAGFAVYLSDLTD